MRRFTVIFLSLLCTLLAESPVQAAATKVVMISIDGLRGITLASLPEHRLNTPNLNEFVEKGAVADGLVGVFPTVTYPSHTSLVTGVPPATHGILGNGLFDPEHKMNGAWYYYSEQIKVPTLWNLAKSKGLRTAAVSWPVTVGAADLDADFPEYRPLRTYEDLMLFRSLTTPGLLSEFEKENGRLVADKVDDRIRAKMAGFLIHHQKPDLLLVHLIEMDHDEHQTGPDSPEAFHALEKIDSCIGLIREEVHEAGLDSQTIFLIVSDHGFLPVDKSLNPRAVLKSIGLAGSDKHPEEWRVGSFGNGASFGLVAHDANDHEAIELATKTFQSLAKDAQWGIDEVLAGSKLKSSEGYSNSFLAVSLKSGFMVGGAGDGEWVTPSATTKGMHGFAPGPKELDAAFAAFGPGIEQAHLGRGKLTDVAPTVVKLLGLDAISNAEGKNLLTK